VPLVTRPTQLCHDFVVVSPQVPQQGELRVPLRVWLLVAGFLLFGGILVLLGGVISGLTDYERSILATVGTAFALVGPLFLAEEVLRQALAATRSVAEQAAAKATAVADQLDQIGARIRSLLDVQETEQAGDRNRAESGDLTALSKVYSEAERWLIGRGLWVAIDPPNLGILVKVIRGTGPADQDYVLLRIESADLKSITGQQSWLPNDDPAEVLLRFGPDLINRNLWPGPDGFTRLKILPKLVQALSRIVDAHQAGASADALTSVVAVAGGWAVTAYGSICNLQEPSVQVPLDELRRDRSAAVTYLKEHLGTWTTDDDAAVDIAIAIRDKYPLFWISGPSGFKLPDKQAS
jgi:hypothetical protein